MFKKILLILLLLPSLCFAGAFEMDEAVIARKNAGACTEVLKQTLDAAGATGLPVGLDDANDYIYHVGSFTASSSYTVTSVSISMKKIGSPTRNIYAMIFSDSEGVSTLVSNGQSSAVGGASLSTVYGDIIFTYADGSRPTLSNGVKYYLGVYVQSVHADDYFYIRYLGTGSDQLFTSPAVVSWTATTDATSTLRAALSGC